MSFDASVCLQCSLPALARRPRASFERWAPTTSSLSAAHCSAAHAGVTKEEQVKKMASVSGLLQVRVRQAKGLDAAPLTL